MSKIGLIQSLVRNGLYYLTEHAEMMRRIMKGGIKLGFWEGEQCEYCNGPIVEKIMDLPRKAGERYILIRNVPVGVCKKCGTKYYAANILKTIESSICGRRKMESKIPMAVYSL